MSFDINKYIHISSDKVEEAVRAAYDLSEVRGLGILQARDGELDQETVDLIVTSRRGVSMDYVHGRCCKFHLYQHDGEQYCQPEWFDHSRRDLVELLTRCGIANPEQEIDRAIAARAA